MLAFEDEQVVGSARVRWVRAPLHVVEGCTCEGSSEVMVASLDGGLWLPLGFAHGEHGLHLEHMAEMVEDEGECEAMRRLSAAFGLPWDKLTLAVLHGLFVLIAALEDDTLNLIASLEDERLAELRLTCPAPANVLRALRMMRDYGARTQ
jgi:hypothetical protein